MLHSVVKAEYADTCTAELDSVIARAATNNKLKTQEVIFYDRHWHSKVLPPLPLPNVDRGT